MDKLDFGKELIRIRQAKGLTQALIAEKCNITIRTIQRIESGAVKPRSSTIKIISEFLEIDFFEISNSNLENHTILWHLKDIFNLKTNTMRKISILSTSLLILILTGINIFNTEAQTLTSNKNEKTSLKSHNNFSENFDNYKIEGNYVFVSKDNKHGLMNMNGKIIIPCEYTSFKVDDGYVLVSKYNKHGLIKMDGKTIIPCEFTNFQVDDGYVLVSKYNKHGLMNLDGKTIIPCEYDIIKFDKGIAYATKNGNTKKIII